MTGKHRAYFLSLGTMVSSSLRCWALQMVSSAFAKTEWKKRRQQLLENIMVFGLENV
jgi:hypothetical protein